MSLSQDDVGGRRDPGAGMDATYFLAAPWLFSILVLQQHPLHVATMGKIPLVLSQLREVPAVVGGPAAGNAWDFGSHIQTVLWEQLEERCYLGQPAA